MKILGREPTLYIALISSLVVVAGTIGFKFLTGEQAGLLVAVITAIFGAINALAVRPISPVAFTYAVGAVVALLASYGLNLTPEQVGAINATVVPILALLARGQVSPQETPLTDA